MQLFLHVILSDEPISFETSLRIWLRKELPEVTYFDVDQQSEDLVIRTAMEAIQQSEATFVYIEGETANPQSIFKIIKKLQPVDEESVRIINNSTNQLIAKLAKAFGSNWQNNIEQSELKQMTFNFFTN